MSFYARLEIPEGGPWRREDFQVRDEAEPNVVCSYGRFSSLQNLLMTMVEMCERGSVFPLLMSYVPGGETRVFEIHELCRLGDEIELAFRRLEDLHLPILVADDDEELRELIRFGVDCQPSPLFEGDDWALTLLSNGVIQVRTGSDFKETAELVDNFGVYITATGEKVERLPDLGSPLRVIWGSGRAPFEDLLQALLAITSQAIAENRRVVFS